jgi:hypothetical protein
MKRNAGGSESERGSREAAPELSLVVPAAAYQCIASSKGGD